MSSVDTWLAAMPPIREVDERIEQLQGELHQLQLIKQLHTDRGEAHVPSVNGHTNGNGDHPTERNGASNGGGALFAENPVVDPGRLSLERKEILQTMLTLPHHEAPPRLVAHKMRVRGLPVDDRHIGLNMSRMQKAGLLNRVRKGVYVIPPHVFDFIREAGAQG